MQASLILGVSQKSIETEFYMVDLPKILEAKAKEKNNRVYEQILIHLATNNRALNEDDHKEFMRNVANHIEINHNDQFDREKFEQLRFLTNSGANRM